MELATTRVAVEAMTRVELGFKTDVELTFNMVENASEEETIEDDTTGPVQVPSPGWHPVPQYACWNPLLIVSTVASLYDTDVHTNSRVYCNSLQKLNLRKSGLWARRC